MREKQIVVRLSDEEYGEVERLSELDGRSKSDWVRRRLRLEAPKKKGRRDLDSRRNAP